MTIRNNAIIKRVATSLGVVSMLLSASGVANADQFDDQINALKAQQAQEQVQANTLHVQASNYQQQAAQEQAQINALNTQLELNQVQSNKLAGQIQDAQNQMAQQKLVLADNIKAMYLDSSVTPLEMLASSSDISDFFNQQQYQDKVRGKIQSAMDAIVTLKAQLDKQQADLTQLIVSQQGQQQQLAKAQANLNQLLAVASQNAAAADAQVRQQNSQIASLRAQQAAVIAAASHHISGGAGCGGYPAIWCNSPQDMIIDSWGMLNRECVSYAAWRATEDGHYVPYWGGHGNANQWPGNARAAGIPVNNTPEVGNVAIYMGGTYGHAMIVEQIKGSDVIVSSFNADNTGHYSVDEWPISSLEFIHFR